MKSLVSSTPISESNCSCFGNDKCQEHRFQKTSFSYFVTASGKFCYADVKLTINDKEYDVLDIRDVQLPESK